MPRTLAGDAMKKIIPFLLLFTLTANFSIVSSSLAQTTTLQIVNARAGEIYPISTNPQDRISFQGNAVDGWQAKIAAIRIDEITQWTTKPTRYGFAATTKVGTFYLEKDGSVKIALKCPMVYQLRGVDAAGNVVAEDNSLHWSVCGETVTCAGCHSEHSIEAASLQKLSAVERFAKTLAAQKPPAPGC